MKGIPHSQKNTSDERHQRSETLQEVVSNKPPLMVRWSIFFFLLVFISIGFIAWFIRYPEWIDTRGEIELTSSGRQRIVTKLTKTDIKKVSLILKNKVTIKIGSYSHPNPIRVEGNIEQILSTSDDHIKIWILILIPENMNKSQEELTLTPGEFYNLEICTEEMSLLERLYKELKIRLP